MPTGNHYYHDLMNPPQVLMCGLPSWFMQYLTLAQSHGRETNTDHQGDPPRSGSPRMPKSLLVLGDDTVLNAFGSAHGAARDRTSEPREARTLAPKE